jgi:hypothetical protein
MHRNRFLIAILFVFAFLAGMSTANAHRYEAAPLVVLNHVDDENVPIRIIVTVQRGEIDLGAGIVMPCGAHQAIAPVVPKLPAPPARDGCTAFFVVTETAGPAPRLLRPPIGA